MENKKIGLAINYDYPDYGGMLQAYATYYKLEKLGYEPETLNIYNLTDSIKKRKIKYFVKNILDFSIVKEKGQVVLKKIRIKLNKEFGSNMAIRYKAFELFCKENFHTSKIFKDWNDISKSCHSYKAVVVGSDQLWLPSNIEGDYYTLNFVPDSVKKIAYATSFGVAEIPKIQEKKVAYFLNRIDFLSAREESGKKIIKKFTGRNVPLVCDPALLLDDSEWDEIATPNRIIKEPYIFCYFMGNNPWQRRFVLELKKKTECKIVSLLHLDQYIASDESYVDKSPYDVSPADFLNLVKNANYVCTDSFHGTVFSIIYKRNFFTFKRFSDKATLSTNTRIDTLLNQMKLKERLVLEGNTVNEMLERKINFEVVQERLEEFRKESLRYLVDSINS